MHVLMRRPSKICATSHLVAQVKSDATVTPPISPPLEHTSQPLLPEQHEIPLKKARPVNPFETFLQLFSIPTSLKSTSPIFGASTRPSLFPTPVPNSGLLTSRNIFWNDSEQQPSQPSGENITNNQPSTSVQTNSFPSWSSWKNWKKFSFDLYIRILHTPKRSRLRLKQTIALLPVVKIKPIIDLGYPTPQSPPISMQLNVKLLDCFKFRIRPNGSTHLEVRAKAPMSDPRFMLDIVYAKDFTSNKESVKISFRALDVAFLKAPRLGAGFKVPIRLGNGIKTTLLVKKFLSPDEHVIENKQKRQIDRSRSHRWRSNRPDNNNISFFDPSSKRPDFSKFLYGPSGVDLKVRCLEYR